MATKRRPETIKKYTSFIDHMKMLKQFNRSGVLKSHKIGAQVMSSLKRIGALDYIAVNRCKWISEAPTSVILEKLFHEMDTYVRPEKKEELDSKELVEAHQSPKEESQPATPEDAMFLVNHMFNLFGHSIISEELAVKVLKESKNNNYTITRTIEEVL